MFKMSKLNPEQRPERKGKAQRLLLQLCQQACRRLRKVFRLKRDQALASSNVAIAESHPGSGPEVQHRPHGTVDERQQALTQPEDVGISKADLLPHQDAKDGSVSHVGDEAEEHKQQLHDEEKIAIVVEGACVRERQEDTRDDKDGKKEEPTELLSLDPHLAPFLQVIGALDLDKLKEFALALRRQQLLDSDCLIGCRCISTLPKYGSYNLVYIIEFTDGVKWCARVPGYGKKPSKVLGEKMDIEYSTMKYIQTYTSFPVPNVIYWTTDPAHVGAAFGLISFVEGKSLAETWFDHENFGEEKRLIALTSIAAQMQKLYVLQFEKTGMLRWNREKPEMFCEVGPALDYYDDGFCLWAGVIKRHQDVDFGRWLKDAIERLREDGGDQYFCSANASLKLLAKSLPKHMRHVPLALSLADLDLQNVFVEPTTGEVTGFIDFDGVAVRPVHIGAAAFPMWLTRNFDPNNYTWQPGCQFEDSPENLQRYREHYNNCWEGYDVLDTGLEYDQRWTENSHLVTTIFNALVLKPYRESMVYALVDHAYNEAFNPSLEERSLWWDRCWDNFEPWKLKLAIARGLWSQEARRASAVVFTRDLSARTTCSIKRTCDYWRASRAMLNF